MGNGNNNYRLIYEHHRQFTKFLAKVKVKMNTPWYRNTLQTSKLAFNPQRKQTQRIWKAIIKNRCYFFFSVCQNVRSFICVPLKIWMQILWGHLWSVLFNKHALTHRIYIHQYRNDLNGNVCRRLTHTHWRIHLVNVSANGTIKHAKWQRQQKTIFIHNFIATNWQRMPARHIHVHIKHIN